PGPPTGVSPGGLPPDGSRVVWFEDSKGDEVGRWLQQPFEGGETAPLVADAEPAWSAGMALGPKGLGGAGRRPLWARRPSRPGAPGSPSGTRAWSRSGWPAGTASRSGSARSAGAARGPYANAGRATSGGSCLADGTLAS